MSSRWDKDDSPPRRKRKDRRWRPGREEEEPDLKRPKESEEHWGKRDEPSKSDEPPVDPEQPNFGLSGLLAKEANKDEQTGVVLKYHEPKEARKPQKKWRLHVFKGEESLPVISLHNSSWHLIGRDRQIVHIATDHPSCSGQHAVIQFRVVPVIDETGCKTGKSIVKPYLMDLESSNGTTLNGKQIKPARYVELVLGDCIKFGFSTREYVLLYEEAVK